MNIETALKTASELLAGWVIEQMTPEPHRLDVVLDGIHVLEAVGALASARWGYLAAITGLDLGVDAGQFEVLYHFCAGQAVVTLRVRTPHAQPRVPSIVTVLPAASFYERELHEMMGVDIVGLTNLKHLYLPDDWPENTYPLRKDAVLK